VLPAQAIERLRAKGGNVTGSLNGLAKVLGTRSKAATHRLLHRLAAAGAVQLSTDRRGIAVALA
jgi:DNA-binding IclR family transcriptional regulator